MEITLLSLLNINHFYCGGISAEPVGRALASPSNLCSYGHEGRSYGNLKIDTS